MPPEDQPTPRPKRSASELNDLVAEKLDRFKSVFVPYPKHVELHDRCDYLQKLGRRTIGKPQMGLRVLAPSGSGKSTAAEAYIDLVQRRRPRTATFVPVLKIDLERASTSKKLMMSILDKFGDPYVAHGNELALRRRAFACFERFGTELLIVDEVQHLNYRNGLKNDVTDTLKGMLDGGVVPMVFLGTGEADQMFKRNLQLNGRLLAPCDLLPLNNRNVDDRRLFAAFVARLELVIVEHDVLPEPSKLGEAGLLPALFEVSQGIVGRVSRLFQAALEIAIRRGATRLEAYDLALAVDRWAIPQSFVEGNPIRRLLDA
ncbi:MAG: TniB family NTP-binding protein [Brevundimonas sp.]|nr:TniB family NTP-binding protein [Brevundimonas sp.]